MNRQAVMERDLVLLGSMAVVRGYTAQSVFDSAWGERFERETTKYRYTGNGPEKRVPPGFYKENER